MKHRFIMAALAGVFAAQATTALADEPFVSGPYVGADFGFALPLKFKAKNSNGGPNAEWLYKKKANVSAMYGAKIGYAFTQNIRADLSLHRINGFSYKGNDFGSELGTKFAHSNDVFDVHNKVASVVTMGNLYYDITELNSKFTPFVTLGLGVARNKSDDYSAQHKLITVHTPGSTCSTLAWGAGLGMWYRVNNIYIDVMYRFLNLGNFRSEGNWYQSSTTAVSTTTEEYLNRAYKSRLNMHTFAVGTRIMF